VRPRLLPALVVLGIAAVVILLGVVIVQEITEPDSGRVTAKTYHPAWWSTSCHKSGKITICTPTHHPECYEIDYTNNGADGDACITAAEYARIQIGSWYGSENQ
jgi:hypothetical protein